MFSSRGFSRGPLLLLAIAIGATLCAARSNANAPAPPTPRRGGSWSIEYTPATLLNGSPVLLELTPPTRLKSLVGSWLGHDLVFEPAGGKKWMALAGVSLE